MSSFDVSLHLAVIHALPWSKSCAQLLNRTNTIKAASQVEVLLHILKPLIAVCLLYSGQVTLKCRGPL